MYSLSQWLITCSKTILGIKNIFPFVLPKKVMYAHEGSGFTAGAHVEFSFVFLHIHIYNYFST